MARPEKSRKILAPPPMLGFKPYGIPDCEITAVKLKFEEYESLKLVNYDGLEQEEAAKLMNISRPTLTRIYNRALKNIVQAFVEGKAIEIEGGNYVFDKDWYRCKSCHKLFDDLSRHIKCEGCALYNSDELVKLSPEPS